MARVASESGDALQQSFLHFVETRPFPVRDQGQELVERTQIGASSGVNFRSPEVGIVVLKLESLPECDAGLQFHPTIGDVKGVGDDQSVEGARENRFALGDGLDHQIEFLADVNYPDVRSDRPQLIDGERIEFSAMGDDTQLHFGFYGSVEEMAEQAGVAEGYLIRVGRIDLLEGEFASQAQNTTMRQIDPGFVLYKTT